MTSYGQTSYRQRLAMMDPRWRLARDYYTKHRNIELGHPMWEQMSYAQQLIWFKANIDRIEVERAT